MIAKRSERTGQQFQVIDLQRSDEDHPEVVFTLSLDTRIRVRARAKMVLGALSKVLPEEWLDTPEALQLREWMWDPRPKHDGVEIGAMHAGADGLLGFMCQPPEHLVAMMPMGANRLMVTVMLFGKEVMPYEIQLPEIDPPDTCWVMDPKRRTVRELRYPELIQEVGVRLDEAHSKEDRGD